MRCQYVWQKEDGTWVQCVWGPHEKTSHKNGEDSVHISRQETWPHYWLETAKEVSTQEIDLSAKVITMEINLGDLNAKPETDRESEHSDNV